MDEVIRYPDVEIYGGPRDGEILQEFKYSVLKVYVPCSTASLLSEAWNTGPVLPDAQIETWHVRRHMNGKLYAVHPGYWDWATKSFKPRGT